MRGQVISAVLLAAAALFVMVSRLNEQGERSADAPDCGFTSDFSAFLEGSGGLKADVGYSDFNFNRTELPCGSFGGRSDPDQHLQKTPVIFIHDNEDLAYGRGTDDGFKIWQTGFRSLASYLMSEGGYTSAELYTTTYGDADDSAANSNYHRASFLKNTRKFIEAVLSYTGSKTVNIISHGMGVTIARKVIKGGTGYDHQAGYYDLGASLRQNVNAFIGIAGYNQGLISCSPGPILPFCSNKDGFFPGTILGTGLSEYLQDLNTRGGTEGATVFTIWSTNDEKAGPGSVVFNKITCRIPGQTGEEKKTTSEWTHYYLRDRSGPTILPLIR